jgi:RecG-like helicase
MLHDRSSTPIVAALGDLAHCSVTIVPYQLGESTPVRAAPASERAATVEAIAAAANGILVGAASQHLDTSLLPADRTPIAELIPRVSATIAGRVRTLRVQPWSGTPSLECTLADESGAITVVWFGRRQLAGIRPGTVMSVVGMPVRHHGITAVLNPEYLLISAAPEPSPPAQHH